MKKIVFVLLAAPLMLIALSSEIRAQDPMKIAEGAKLWSNNCMRCHSARSPMERSDRAWTTIAMHMRARANLTKSEMSVIRSYLQAMNAPEFSGQSGMGDVLAETEVPATKKVESEAVQEEPDDTTRNEEDH